MWESGRWGRVVTRTASGQGKQERSAEKMTLPQVEAVEGRRGTPLLKTDRKSQKKEVA